MTETAKRQDVPPVTSLNIINSIDERKERD